MSKRVLECLPELMRKPAFREAWDALEAEFDLAQALITARMEAGLTQADVADKMGVSQPAVARLESGRNVSVRSLRRYAAAVGRPIRFTIQPEQRQLDGTAPAARTKA